MLKSPPKASPPQDVLSLWIDLLPTSDGGEFLDSFLAIRVLNGRNYLQIRVPLLETVISTNQS